MKNEPCIRLGMRIKPKISEKPADSRNNRPPSAKLLIVSVGQALTRICQASTKDCHRLMFGYLAAGWDHSASRKPHCHGKSSKSVRSMAVRYTRNPQGKRPGARRSGTHTFYSRYFAGG